MSAFTCAACGGFKYNQTPVLLINQDLKICIDCHENGVQYVGDSKPPSNYGIPRKKPGLREVLVSIHAAEFNIHCNYNDWIMSNGADEEAVAEKCQKLRPDLWKDHYHRITGEPWQ